MKASLSTAKLHAAVRATSIAVMSHPSMPVLAGVRLSATDAGLELATFDFDTSARITIEPDLAAAGSEPVVISHRLLDKCLSVASAKSCDLELEGAHLTLTAGRAKWQLPLILADFPTMPTVPTKIGTVDAESFKAAATAVAPAASRSDESELNRLTGVWITWPHDDATSSGEVTMVATDRYRMHAESAHLDAAKIKAGGGSGVLVPAARMIQLGRLVDGTVTLRWDDSLFGVETGSLNITTRLLDDGNNGQWIAWRSLLDSPSKPRMTATVEREDLLAALKQCMAVSQSDVQIVRVTIVDGALTVALAEVEANTAGDSTVDAQIEGPGLVAHCNGVFFADALASLDTPQVDLRYVEPNKAFGVARAGEPVSRLMMPISREQSKWLE